MRKRITPPVLALLIVLILFTAISCKDKSCSHVWNDGEMTTPATCKDEGLKTYTCTICGTKKTETIPVTSDHKFEDVETTKEPTCTEKGSKTVKCSVCGKTDTEEIAALGHSLVYEVSASSGSSVVSITAPTCVTAGSYTMKCTRTGCTYSDTKTLEKDADVHCEGAYNSSDYKKAAATAEGSITVACGDCEVTGKTLTTYIDNDLVGTWKCDGLGTFDFKTDGTLTLTTSEVSSNTYWGVVKVEEEKAYKVVYVLEASNGLMVLCYFPESSGSGYLVLGDELYFTRVTES